jgi:hypothetical protein
MPETVPLEVSDDRTAAPELLNSPEKMKIFSFRPDLITPVGSCARVWTVQI